MVTSVSGHPSSRTERRKAELRQRLYRAAIDLFRAHGFDATPVEAITEAADTGKGTFFNYFPTKEHVLAAYHDEMTGQILRRMRQIRATRAEDAVQRALQICADWVEQDIAMGRIVVAKVFSNPVLLSTDLANTRQFMEWFRARLEAGMVTGELRATLDVPVMLSMLAAVLSSTMNSWVLDPAAFDLRDMLARKTRFVFDAARTHSRREAR